MYIRHRASGVTAFLNRCPSGVPLSSPTSLTSLPSYLLRDLKSACRYGAPPGLSRTSQNLTGTLPKPLATFPELSGSARERSGAAQKVPRGPSGAPAPARAESGRPQNWSPAISGSPNPLKI